ncbi:MAG: ribosome maturation factor RimM [Bacilli bacterium]|nr:ribosome maturation factor RimM [Bacilli bacterium]
MEYLLLGTIIDSHGLDGTLKVFSSTNYAEERYQEGNHVFLFDPNSKERKEYVVIDYRPHGRTDLVTLEGITTPEQAKALKGYEIQIIKDANDLEEGYYFYSDLRGCSIVDKDGKEYGIVKEVEEFPAQITLRVARKNAKDFFVPFLKDFIVNVDIENKKITINVMEGML